MANFDHVEIGSTRENVAGFHVQPGTRHMREAPYFVDRFSTGEVSHRGDSFWQHWAMDGFRGGIGQRAFSDVEMVSSMVGLDGRVLNEMVPFGGWERMLAGMDDGGPLSSLNPRQRGFALSTDESSVDYAYIDKDLFVFDKSGTLTEPAAIRRYTCRSDKKDGLYLGQPSHFHQWTVGGAGEDALSYREPNTWRPYDVEAGPTADANLAHAWLSDFESVKTALNIPADRDASYYMGFTCAAFFVPGKMLRGVGVARKTGPGSRGMMVFGDRWGDLYVYDYADPPSGVAGSDTARLKRVTVSPLKEANAIRALVPYQGKLAVVQGHEVWFWDGGGFTRSTTGDLRTEEHNYVVTADAAGSKKTEVKAVISATAASIDVDDTTDFAAGDVILVDGEKMTVTAVTDADTLAVTRHAYGTKAASHSVDTAVKLLSEWRAGDWSEQSILTDTHITCGLVWGGYVYLAGYSGYHSKLWKLDAAGATEVAVLSDNFHVLSMCEYNGALFLGGVAWDFERTKYRGRVYTFNGSSVSELEMKRAGAPMVYDTLDGVWDMAVWDGMLVLPLADSPGVVFYDAREDAFFRSQEFGGTSVTTDSDADVMTACTVFHGRLFIYSPNRGLLWQRDRDDGTPATFVLETSIFDADVRLVDKLFHRLTVLWDDASDACSCEVRYRLGLSDEWTYLNTVSPTVKDVLIPETFEDGGGVLGTHIQLRFVFTVPDGAVFGRFRGFYLRYLVEPKVRRNWAMTLVCADNIERTDGSMEPRNARQLRAELWRLRSLRKPVFFRDADGAEYRVVIASLSEFTPSLNLEDGLEHLVSVQLWENDGYQVFAPSGDGLFDPEVFG